MGAETMAGSRREEARWLARHLFDRARGAHGITPDAVMISADELLTILAGLDEYPAASSPPGGTTTEVER